MAISRTDFDYVSQMARRQAGIMLEPGKEYFAEMRLGRLAKQEGFASIAELIQQVRAKPNQNGLHHKLLCALATHETFFFRDFHPFEALRTSILPALFDQRSGSRQLRIWSAACSTGQEAYSLALLLREHFPQSQDWQVSILATDLSPAVLKTAQAARYSQLEVNRGLPAGYLAKYFTEQGDRWCLKEEIKQRVEFREMNLVEPWPSLPPFDLVFMRNVMIYFDIETKKAIMKKIGGCLLSHGFLFLGTAETMMNLDQAYEAVAFDNTVAYRPLRAGLPA